MEHIVKGKYIFNTTLCFYTLIMLRRSMMLERTAALTGHIFMWLSAVCNA